MKKMIVKSNLDKESDSEVNNTIMFALSDAITK